MIKKCQKARATVPLREALVTPFPLQTVGGLHLWDIGDPQKVAFKSQKQVVLIRVKRWRMSTLYVQLSWYKVLYSLIGQASDQPAGFLTDAKEWAGELLSGQTKVRTVQYIIIAEPNIYCMLETEVFIGISVYVYKNTLTFILSMSDLISD